MFQRESKRGQLVGRESAHNSASARGIVGAVLSLALAAAVSPQDAAATRINSAADPALAGAVTQTFDAGAHDVLITSGAAGTTLLGAADSALGHLLQTGRYALLWAKWFPGTTVPPEVGT